MTTGGSVPEISRFFFYSNENSTQYVSNKKCVGLGFETSLTINYANLHNTFMQITSIVKKDFPFIGKPRNQQIRTVCEQKNIAHLGMGERENITVRKMVLADLFGNPFCSEGPIWGKAGSQPFPTTRDTGVNKHCISPLFARLIKRTDLIFCFLIFDFAVFACVTPDPLTDDDW